MNDIIKILGFIDTINNLKYEIRYGDCPDLDKRDSVAAHCWRLSVLCYLVAESIADQLPLDLCKVLKLSVIHDIPESAVGDTPFSTVLGVNGATELKTKKEELGMRRLCDMLPTDLGKEVYDLWQEYEEAKTPEAKFVKIMDKIEGTHQSMYVGIGHGRVNERAAVLQSNKGFGWFAPTDQIIKFVRTELKKYFETNNLEWKSEYEL
jgi:putative hydrolase of HD superfamily